MLSVTLLSAYCQGHVVCVLLTCSATRIRRPGDVTIFREMGELGLLGPTIPTNMAAPALELCQLRLAARDRARGLGLSPMASVQSSLVMVFHQRVRFRGAEAEVPARVKPKASSSVASA